MFSKSQIVGSLTGLGLFLGIASGVTAAEMPASTSTQTNQFRRIKQPLGLKVGVTVGGLALIGVELWWFLGSKNKSKQAETNQGAQRIRTENATLRMGKN